MDPVMLNSGMEWPEFQLSRLNLTCSHWTYDVHLPQQLAVVPTLCPHHGHRKQGAGDNSIDQKSAKGFSKASHYGIFIPIGEA